MKALMPAAILAALGAAPALAAPAAPSTALPPVFWMISPAEAGCRTELELTGRSGAAVTVALNSDGELVSLSFPKENLPERAFLPIRIDRKAHANLMLRKADGRSGELVLSEETLAALRRGGELDIAWLAGEPLGTSLMGSGQAIDDLKTCGAQVAAEIRARRTAEADAKARAEAEARAKAVADAQIEAAKAQAAAADAERQQLAAAAERQPARAGYHREGRVLEPHERVLQVVDEAFEKGVLAGPGGIEHAFQVGAGREIRRVGADHQRRELVRHAVARKL